MAIAISIGIALVAPSALAMHFDSNHRNPHAAKSSKIQEKLDERSIPLEEYMRAMIDQGLYVISSKEELSARLAYYDNNYHSNLHQGVIQLLSDESISDHLTEISTYVDGRETLDMRYLRIEFALEEANTTLATDMLNNIPTDFDLDERKDQELQDYIAIYSMLIDMEIESRNSLHVEEVALITEIAEKHSTRAAGLAKSILSTCLKIDIPEVLVHPDNAKKSIERRRKPSNSVVLTESLIWPNPATDYVLINHKSLAAASSIVVYDAQGRMVIQQFLKSQRRTSILKLESLNSGNYNLEIKDSSGNSLISEAVIVAK